MQLNVYSALAALAVGVFFIPLQMYIAKQFMIIKLQTSAQTDSRIRCISEIIDGITSVKSFNWEIPFFNLIRKLRQKECQYLSKTNFYRSLNSSIYVPMFFTGGAGGGSRFNGVGGNGGNGGYGCGGGGAGSGQSGGAGGNGGNGLVIITCW